MTTGCFQYPEDEADKLGRLSPTEQRRLVEGEFVTRKVTLVVAGNYHQYRMFLREVGLASEDALYVCQPRHIMGLGKKHVERIVYFGEFWRNPLCGNRRLLALEDELK